MLYEEFKQDVKANKVYLFGLSAFCGDYTRLHGVVGGCIASADESQMKILRIVCCLHKHADFNIKLSLLASFIPHRATRIQSEADFFDTDGVQHLPGETGKVAQPVSRPIRAKAGLRVRDPVLESFVNLVADLEPRL